MRINWQEALRELMPQITRWRHELHSHPEVSGQEQWTKQFIMDRLGEMGIPCVEFSDCNAVMGVLSNGGSHCVAIRADMDALPVKEQTGLPFASVHDGVMHACGHGVHMTFSLGSALYLSTHRDEWKGTMKWLFEPCEETTGGGKMMVAQGCMENPTVECVIGQHCNPNYPVNTFIGKPGAESGSSDELYMTIRGKGCHGAYPHQGTDAIVITAQVISALQILVSRNVDPFDSAVVTFGSIQGGTANNVIADEVRLRGTLRTLKDSTRQYLRKRIRETVEMVAAGMGGKGELEIRPSYGAVYNDEHYYDICLEAAKSMLQPENIVNRENPSLGVESFCFFEDHTPGVYYDIGTGLSTALHSPTFLVDESVLLTGVAMQCASVLGMLEE